MKTRIPLSAVVAIAVAGFATTLRADEQDTKAVQAANDQFYVALNALFTGDAEPMKAVWSHKDDITYMGPVGDYRMGWKSVEEEWDAQAAKKLGGKVGPQQVRISAGRDVAVVSCYEVGENQVDGAQPVKIRCTSIFRKEGGKWKMIGHHTDTLPFLQK